MALPLIPLAAVWAQVVGVYLLQFGLNASLNLSYWWERSSLTAVINWAPTVASIYVPELASACSVVSAAYNVALPLVRFAHLVAQTMIVLEPTTQLVIVTTVSSCGLVVCNECLSSLMPLLLTVWRSLPRRRAHLFFWFTQILRFARCANSIRVALSFDPFYRQVLAVLAFLFAEATCPYVEAALWSLFDKMQAPLRRFADACSGRSHDVEEPVENKRRRTVQAPTVQAHTVQAPTVQAPTVQAPTVQAPTVQAPTVQAPVTTAAVATTPCLNVDLLRQAQLSTARRHARTAAKKAAAAPTAPATQAPVAPKTASVPVTTVDMELLRRAQSSTARRHARKAAKKAPASTAAGGSHGRPPLRRPGSDSVLLERANASTARRRLRLAKKA